MRLSSIALSTSDDAEEVTFSVLKQEPNYRYLVRAMVGIDAEQIVPKFYRFGLVSGKKYYEYTMRPRDIVMRVSLNPIFSINEDVSEIRDAIYRLISANRSGELTLKFKDAGVIVSVIKGNVTKMEVPYFTRTPELQITINCPDYMFRSPAPYALDLDELPSANPVRVLDEKSTAPHGLNFKVKFTAVTSSFVIQDDPSDPDWQFEVIPPTSFQIDDELWFSSEFGAKSVFWNKDSGTDIELMDKISSGSVWPEVFPGVNTLYFMQIANFDWLELNHKFAYWGL